MPTVGVFASAHFRGRLSSKRQTLRAGQTLNFKAVERLEAFWANGAPSNFWNVPAHHGPKAVAARPAFEPLVVQMPCFAWERHP